MFDNSQSKRKPVAPTFLFELDGVSFLYTYIRKNACSSFKKLFRSSDKYHSEPVYKNMFENSRVNIKQAISLNSEIGLSIFVYRDPIDRAFSVFKNKLIQKSGAGDITKSIEKVMGCNVDELCFRTFVEDYVSIIGSESWTEVDGHLYPQSWHLMPIVYTHAIELKNLYLELNPLLGEKLADRYFKKPINSSESKVEQHNFYYDENTTVREFQEAFKNSGFLPKIEKASNQHLNDLLRDIYVDDFKMILNL